MKKTLVVDNGKTQYFLDGAKKIVIKVYDGCKYEKGSEKIAEVEYEIVGFGIYNGADFSEEEYADILNNEMEDKYDEYLRLWLRNDETATFRNSNVDMFLR